jgi:probable phosphoglycerate mutase
MLIHLIRHAETEWHAEDKYAGHTEIALTKKGVDQSFQLANWASKKNISSIYTSGLSRAIETARPSLIQLRMESMVDTDLNEVNFGLIEGLNKQAFKENFPMVWNNFQTHPASTLFPSGESGEIALMRAEKSIMRIAKKRSKGEIMIVSHGTLIRLLLTYFLGKDLNSYRTMFPVIDNLGVSSLVLNISEDLEQTKFDFQLLCYNCNIN